MNPIITVVIPVYNGEKYVRRAVESVVNQPERNAVKVLLVNDGSKDASGTICDALALEYKNVTVLHKENGGVSSARNLGIQNVTTKYVAFLDCDDWWEPAFLDAEMYNEFSKVDSCDVYQFAYQEVDFYYRLKKIFPVNSEKNVYDGNGLNRYDWAYHCSFVYRTALLRNNAIKYPNSRVGEDGPFVEMALFCSRSLNKLNRIIFSYWKNNNSCVHITRRIDSLKEEYRALLQEKAFLAEHGYDIDVDSTFVWSVANSFPKLAATCSYHELHSFMDNVLSVLNERSDIHFRKELWDRLEFFKKSPRICWLKHQLITGIPMRLQIVTHKIPILDQIIDYLVSRFRRGYISM